MCFWPFFLNLWADLSCLFGNFFFSDASDKVLISDICQMVILWLSAVLDFFSTTVYLLPSDALFVVSNQVLVSDIRPTNTLWLSIVLGLVYCVLSVAFWHSTCSYWVLTLLVFLDVVTSYWRKVYLLLEKEGYGLTSVWDLFWRTVVAMTFCATKCPYCNYFPGLYFRPRGVGLLFSVAVTWWNTHFVY